MIVFGCGGGITDVRASNATLIAIGCSSGVCRIFTGIANGTIVWLIVFGCGGGITEVRASNALLIAIGCSSGFGRIFARTANGAI